MGQPAQRMVVEPPARRKFEQGSTLGNRVYAIGSILGDRKGSHYHNEDSYSYYHFTSENMEEFYSVFCCCDGHGGYEASKYTTDNLPKFLHEEYKKNLQFFMINDAMMESFMRFDTQVIQHLENDVKNGQSQHDKYLEKGEKNDQYRTGNVSKRPPGTTVEVFVLIEYTKKNFIEMINLHVGDSECMIPGLKDLDPDLHTGINPDEVSRIMRAGGVVTEIGQHRINYCGVRNAKDWDGHNDDFLFQMSRTFGNPSVKQNPDLRQDQQVHIPCPTIRRKKFLVDEELEKGPNDLYVFMFSDGVGNIVKGTDRKLSAFMDIAKNGDSDTFSQLIKKSHKGVPKWFGPRLYIPDEMESNDNSTNLFGALPDPKKEHYMVTGIKLAMYANKLDYQRSYNDDTTIICLRLNKKWREEKDEDEDDDVVEESEERKRKRDGEEEDENEQHEAALKKRKLNENLK